MPQILYSSIPEWARPAHPPDGAASDRAEPEGASRVVVAVGERGEAAARRWAASSGAGADVELLRSEGVETAVELLLGALARRATGVRVLLVGPVGACLRLRAAAYGAGLGDDEIQVAQVGAGPVEVFCPHCGVATSADCGVDDLVECSGCARRLLVYSHVSRRTGQYLGFMADAETQEPAASAGSGSAPEGALVPPAPEGLPPRPAPRETLELVVAAIGQPCAGVRSFTLAAADGAELPGFVPGSHLVLHAGERRNAYSLTSDGVRPAEYSVSVLRVADGRGGSNWLHDCVREGDTLTALPPRSAFAPAARARKHLLVAGGIGVTPILSHLRAARRWGREAQVLYAFRGPGAAHLDEILELTGQTAELFPSREGFAARLAEALAEQPVGTHLYVCGPQGMIDHAVTAAQAAGWPASRVHFERFGAAEQDPGEPFELRLASSAPDSPAQAFEVPAGTSALDALERGGAAVPSLCRQGVCGECRLRVVGGLPVHRDLYLSEQEKESGEVFLPCVSRAEAGSVLEVSL